MIELITRDDTEQALWAATLDLAVLVEGLPWTLVGAQMVMPHAFEAGEVPGRTTGDLDLLFGAHPAWRMATRPDDAFLALRILLRDDQK